MGTRIRNLLGLILSGYPKVSDLEGLQHRGEDAP